VRVAGLRRCSLPPFRQNLKIKAIPEIAQNEHDFSHNPELVIFCISIGLKDGLAGSESRASFLVKCLHCHSAVVECHDRITRYCMLLVFDEDDSPGKIPASRML